MKQELNIGSFNKLMDKSLSVEERLDLASLLWEFNDLINIRVNKQQFISDWILDLLVNRRKNSLSESETILIYERLSHFLNDAKFKNAPINAGSSFVQALFEGLGSNNTSLSEAAQECCFSLFKTKFSLFLTRNIDQMTKLVNFYIEDVNKRLDSNSLDKKLERVNFILQKYLLCLKSQQNQTRLFSRLCSQILFGLLNMIVLLKPEENEDILNTAWTILKYSLFSKSHANIFIEFFKNLPSSFSPKSNYQVAVLFSTIQTEANKNFTNLKSICDNIHIFTREILSTLNCADYKQRIQTVQFIVNLIWGLKNAEFRNLMEVDGAAEDKIDSVDSILKALRNVFQLVDELNLFNQLDDQNNANLFKNWLKNLISQSFKLKFNEFYVEFLIQLLQIDHLILDADLDLIFTRLQEENNLSRFLIAYLDANIKFRQFSRCTHKIIDSLKTNPKLQLSVEFCENYSKSLENYHVDIQSVVALWKDLNEMIESAPTQEFKRELVKLVTSVMARINLTNQRLPSHLKIQAIDELNKTKQLLHAHLDQNLKNQNDEDIVYYLDSYFTAGLLFIVLYRYSLVPLSNSTNTTTITHMQSCLKDLDNFLDDLNAKLKLSEMMNTTNFKLLFYLNKLELVNVLAFNLKQDEENAKKSLSVLISHQNADFTNIETLIQTMNSFSIEKNIDNLQHYSILHLKHFLVDNFYLLSPLLIDNDQARLRECLRSILGLVLRVGEKKLNIDDVNLDAVFNDKCLLKQLLSAFLDLVLLNSTNEENDPKQRNRKFLEKILNFVENAEDEDIKISLLTSKKFKKVTLNKTQTELFFKFASLLPVEYLEAKYSFVFFILCEKVAIKDSPDLRRKCLETYFRCFATSLLTFVPMEKVHTWLLGVFDLFLANDSNELISASNEIFDKLIKRTINFMLLENTVDFLVVFVEKIMAKSAQNAENLSFISIVNLTLIKILEKIAKVKEHSSTLNKSDAYLNKLNSLFGTILAHFMQGEDLLQASPELSEKQNYFICSILIRFVCSANFGEKNASSPDQLDYFKQLFSNCLKTHKSKMKNLNEAKISSFQVDFLKTCVFNARKLSNFELKFKPTKLCKQIIDIYASNAANCVEMTYYNQLTPSGQKEALGARGYLIRSIAVSLANLDPVEFVSVLARLEEKLNEAFGGTHAASHLVKLLEFVKFACCEAEINEALKVKFSEFVQKILIQLQLYLTTQKSAINHQDLISLLGAQNSIVSSKYFLFPSHLAISTLQLYASFSFDKLELDEYFPMQELLCKTLNNILTRYSNKFARMSAVVCNLLIKIIGTTTSLANQNHVTAQNLNLAILAAQDLERIITQLSAFKTNFSKIAPFMIGEYVCRANAIAIHPSVKVILSNAVYNLISLCDIHGVAQLHVALPSGAKEVFKNLYAEYEKYFKYTGKA